MKYNSTPKFFYLTQVLCLWQSICLNFFFCLSLILFLLHIYKHTSIHTLKIIYFCKVTQNVLFNLFKRYALNLFKINFFSSFLLWGFSSGAQTANGYSQKLSLMVGAWPFTISLNNMMLRPPWPYQVLLSEDMRWLDSNSELMNKSVFDLTIFFYIPRSIFFHLNMSLFQVFTIKCD